MQVLTNVMVGVSAAPGTGTIALGAAIPGGQTWAACGAVDGTAYGYRIDDGQNWEIGAGTYTASGSKLTRGPIFSSAANNAAIAATANAVVSQVGLPSDFQAALGFTPVQQGGGSGQSANKLYLGWNGSALLLQVDNSAQGRIWSDSLASFTNNANGNYWKLPNGLILQMQRLSIQADTAFNWPVTFPNGIMDVLATMECTDYTASVAYTAHVDQISTSQYAVRPRSISGGSVGQPAAKITVNILGLGN